MNVLSTLTTKPAVITDSVKLFFSLSRFPIVCHFSQNLIDIVSYKLLLKNEKTFFIKVFRNGFTFVTKHSQKICA